jgi:hypothetical protein
MLRKAMQAGNRKLITELNYMKNFFLGLAVASLIGAVGIGAYYYGTQQNKTAVLPTPTVGTVVTPTGTIVGNDKDAYGCIGSAGYSWCEVKNKCLRTWEEPCVVPTVSENTAELIKQALIKKNNWTNGDDLIVSISKNDGTYASGGVKEKNAEAGGGYFFAAKVAGVWKIVADGNGTISCESLAPYPDYPISMIPECWDEKTGKSVNR